MPLVKIDMWEGRTERIKEELIRNVSDAVAKSLDVPLSDVSVILYDIPKVNWGIGGIPTNKIDPGRD